jgi:hypothetical protein
MFLEVVQADRSVAVIVKSSKQRIGVLDLSILRQMQPIQDVNTGFKLWLFNDTIFVKI